LQCHSSTAVFLRIRSVRILDSIAYSKPLVWLFSPAWDAVKLTCQKAVFICLWSMTSDNGRAPERKHVTLLPIPDVEDPAVYPTGIKASCVRQWDKRELNPSWRLIFRFHSGGTGRNVEKISEKHERQRAMGRRRMIFSLLGEEWTKGDSGRGVEREKGRLRERVKACDEGGGGRRPSMQIHTCPINETTKEEKEGPRRVMNSAHRAAHARCCRRLGSSRSLGRRRRSLYGGAIAHPSSRFSSRPSPTQTLD
jgi:hypothetical protein